VNERYGHLLPSDRLAAAVGENVLVQLENLREFPLVAERLDSGKLQMSGWVYKIETGEIFSFDPSLGQFVELGSSSSSDLPTSTRATAR
ncbi:MAG TPA: carbonic anhydrase, partial [Polyangiaceae bacterium]